jgi:hypothetical protein
MKVFIDHAGDTVFLELPALEAVRAFLGDAEKQHAFMVELTSPPRPFEPYTIHLSVPDTFEFSFPARPVQIFDRGAYQEVAFQFEEWPKSKSMELERKLNPESTDVGREDEMKGVSPMIRIQQMDPNQKARLALLAGRTERHILRRDGSAQVLTNLLSNPKVEAEDILQIVRSTHVNGGLMQRVAGDRRWNTNAEIKNAIVRNPKTPAPMAIRLLDSLRTEDLRQMAKIGGPLRENVRRAALAAYLRRGGKR